MDRSLIGHIWVSAGRRQTLYCCDGTSFKVLRQPGACLREITDINTEIEVSVFPSVSFLHVHIHARTFRCRWLHTLNFNWLLIRQTTLSSICVKLTAAHRDSVSKSPGLRRLLRVFFSSLFSATAVSALLWTRWCVSGIIWQIAVIVMGGGQITVSSRWIFQPNCTVRLVVMSKEALNFGIGIHAHFKLCEKYFLTFMWPNYRQCNRCIAAGPRPLRGPTEGSLCPPESLPSSISAREHRCASMRNA